MGGLLARRTVVTLIWLAAASAFVMFRDPSLWRSPTDRFEQAKLLASQGELSRAIAVLDAEPDGGSADIGSLVYKGYLEIEAQRGADAARSFGRVLRHEPENVEAMLGMAASQRLLGDSAGARHTLDRLAESSLSADQRHRRIQLYAQLGYPKRALHGLEALLDEEPTSPELLQEALALALSVDKWELAATLGERLARASSDPHARRFAQDRQALALRAAGRPEAAYEVYTSIAGDDNLRQRAELALQLERFDAAAELYRAAVALEADDADLQRRFAYALDRSGNQVEATETYGRLVERGRAETADRVRYALLLNSRQRYDESWDVLRPLITSPEDQELAQLRARTAHWARADGAAVPLIRGLLAHRPGDAELWRMLVEEGRRANDTGLRLEALRSYVHLTPADLDARRELGDVLAQSGSTTSAIAVYEDLAREPAEARDIRRLAELYEASGDLDASFSTYAKLVADTSRPDSELLLRLARLSAWRSRPDEAVDWYRRYVRAAGPLADDEARVELARALVDAARPQESVDLTSALIRTGRVDAEILEIAARGASEAGYAQLAAARLDDLAEHRALTAEEEVWRAGQHRAAGDDASALEIFDRLRREADAAGEPTLTSVLEAVGDIHFAAGDYPEALLAYRDMPADARTAGQSLKLARSAARTGYDAELATSTYETYLAQRPDDHAVRLEAARYYAAAQMPESAIEHYEAYIDARGATGLGLEMARISLAAERFEEAESWARQALAEGEAARGSQLALAQSLHLQGRTAEGQEIIDEMIIAAPDDPQALHWAGIFAIATGQHLEAFDLLDRALAARDAELDTQQLWLRRGEAARKRSDYARAARSYDEAMAAGLPALAAEAELEDLAGATVPWMSIPPEFAQDSNDLQVAQAGLSAGWWPAKRARISGRLLFGRVEQDEAAYERTVGRIRVEQLFAMPSLELSGSLGFEDYRSGGSQAAGAQAGGSQAGGSQAGRSRTIASAAALYHFADGSSIGVDASRRTLLTDLDEKDPRRFNRIVDLGALGPNFGVAGARGLVDVAVGTRQRFRVEGGIDSYEDGNRRVFTYGHYIFPLRTDANNWTAIQPNVFAETFRDTTPHYFSPERHVGIGGMLHTVRRNGEWFWEAEVNPQLLWTDSDPGFCVHGLFEVRRRLGRFSLSANAFLFHDRRNDYTSWRLAGVFSVPLAR